MAEDLAKQAWFVRVQTVESTTEPTAIDFAVGKPTKWTIESIPDGLYLKGEQQTWNGTNKFMVVCMPKGSIALYAIFDAGMNAEDAMRFHTIVSRNPTLYPLKV